MKYNSDCEANIYCVERSLGLMEETVKIYLNATGIRFEYWYIKESLEAKMRLLWYGKRYNDLGDREPEYYRRAYAAASKLIEIAIPLCDPELTATLMERRKELEYEEEATYEMEL